MDFGQQNEGRFEHFIGGLERGTRYDIQLHSKDAAGSSPWTEILAGKPQPPGECGLNGAVDDPANSPGLVHDCEALLQVKVEMADCGTLNWSSKTLMSE